jgi:hypothetical protein
MRRPHEQGDAGSNANSPFIWINLIASGLQPGRTTLAGTARPEFPVMPFQPEQTMSKDLH